MRDLEEDNATIDFGDPIPENIPPAIAAELVEQIEAEMPEIRELVTQLRRRADEEQS